VGIIEREGFPNKILTEEGKNWYNVNKNDFYLGEKCGKI
jgi:hypothetical protein